MTHASLWMNLENIALSDHMLEDYIYMKGPEQASLQRERERGWVSGGCVGVTQWSMVHKGTGFLSEEMKMS